MARFGVFGSFLIIETSQKWGRILWNPWQCKLKLKYMKNPSFGALHSPLPSLEIGYQANQRCKKENQRKKSNNQHFRMVMRKFHIACEVKRRGSCRIESRTKWNTISHTVRNFTHHVKPQEVAKEFCTPCKIFLCIDFVRFLSSDILCNFLVSPCNQPRYFILYLFRYFLGNTYIRRETEGGWYICFSLNTCKFR